HDLTTRMHEAAADTIQDDLTRIPIREVVDLNKINLIQDTVVDIHWKDKEARLENGVVTYDMLVIGLGFDADTQGIPWLEEHAFTLSSFNFFFSSRRRHTSSKRDWSSDVCSSD